MTATMGHHVITSQADASVSQASKVTDVCILARRENMVSTARTTVRA